MFYSKANREIKSSAFIDYFEEPQRFLSLYNAVSGLNLPPDTCVEFKTLDNVLFYGKKNDIAALLDDRIIFLIEHQSTVNENMAVRLFIYLGRVYEKIIDRRKLYEGRLFKIPRPEFIVLYNGVVPYPKEKTIKLSDSFVSDSFKEATGFGCCLELEVKVININYGENNEIIERSKYLNGYSYFMESINNFQRQGNDYTTAVVMAVKHCISENIMADYLEEHSSEVINMLTEEFDMDFALEVRYEEGIVQGMEKGLEQGIIQGMEQGLEQGIVQGMEQGLEKGIEQGAVQIAANMLKDGLDPALISKYSGLDMNAVLRLKAMNF